MAERLDELHVVRMMNPDQVGSIDDGRLQANQIEPRSLQTGHYGTHSFWPLGVPGARVVVEGYGVAGDHQLHAHTLPQMRDRPAVEGSWPDRLTMRRAWARAEARPWNDSWEGSQLRLVRGGHDFLEAASKELARLGAAPVHSPALFPSATTVWERAGYTPFRHLIVMERQLFAPGGLTDGRVTIHTDPPWDEMLRLDESAFDGFWRMNRLGLEEAAMVTPKSAVFTFDSEGIPVGFAIVGAEHGFSYLQRLAVHTAARRRGVGTALVEATARWAGSVGSRLMMLNVQPDAQPARALYRGLGFNETGTFLRVMRRDASEPY